MRKEIFKRSLVLLVTLAFACAALSAPTGFARIRHGLAAAFAGPQLSIPAYIPAFHASTVSIPVHFKGQGSQIASTVFSIDFDERWLAYDAGVPDSLKFTLPGSFSGSCAVDPADTDGEIDCFILDSLVPLEALPDGVVLTVVLKTLNAPVPTLAPVMFSENSPPASFGGTSGNSVPGETVAGSVWIGDGTPPPDGTPVAPGGLFLPVVRRDFIPTFTPTPTGRPSSTPTPTSTSGASQTPTATRTPTLTRTGQACDDEIANGGFESSSGWELPATMYTAAYTGSQAHSGSRSLRTGITVAGDNIYSYSSVRQRVSIRADADRADLQFWYYPRSGEALAATLAIPWLASGHAFAMPEQASDLHYVIILDTADNWIDTLLWELSDTRSWTRDTFDLLDYAGRSIQLEFGTFNNGTGGISSMHVDDVSLTVCP